LERCIILIQDRHRADFRSSPHNHSGFSSSILPLQQLPIMGVAAGELIVPFTGAIQAAFSVLLTIAFGVVAAQCNLLSPNAAKEVSKLCVRMFLPALLIYKIGSNLHQDTGVRYVPVLSKFNPVG
jgi:hypothetical protein